VAAVRAGGNYIHVVDTATMKVKAKLYRGMKKTEIRSVSFSFDNNYLAVVSDAFKIHIFNIGHSIESKYNIL
jgi:hypothetical protein